MEVPGNESIVFTELVPNTTYFINAFETSGYDIDDSGSLLATTGKNETVMYPSKLFVFWFFDQVF